MSSTPTKIRPLVPGDRAAWEPLWSAYQDFYRVDLGPEVTDATWRRFHDPVEPMFALGATRDSRLVGIVHYVFHRSAWMLGPVCYLQDLFTVPDQRGSGVGRTLIEAVRAEAERAGASRLYWLTHESNTQARILYERIATNSGFIQYRIELER